ncbi:TrmH family RNA methyltransferase [Flavicella sediminum]|uniref:TrmH family RNA methyltransferase n=1 Tax=Flavicella sediminum TaxID=2585141 RepID=UPI0011218A73|nr:RNA methyltransferase [Flavicella sediminum]
MEDKQHLISFLEEFVTEHRKEIFQEVLKDRTRHFTVILEDLFQKHNTSAITRSCDIFGIQDLHIIENKYKTYVSNQVGKGSQKWLTFHRYNEENHNTQTCIDKVKAAGYQIIATTPHEKSSFVGDFDVTKKSAFVFGVEKAGVSDMMLEQADGHLKVPMYGFTESLNVSVAAAIVLQDVAGRVRKTDTQWQLTREEQQDVYLQWLKKSIKSIDKIMERYKS